MVNNPYLNAILASGYIVGIVTVISLFAGKGDNGDTVLVPMMMLSLLVLSAAFMGFLFFYRPVTMLLEGKRPEAAAFFFRTLGTFAVITIGFIVANAVILA